MKKLKLTLTLFLAIALTISCVCFVSLAAEQGAAPKSGGNIFVHILIALAIGFVVALIVTGVMKGKLKTVRPENAAANYTREGSFKVDQSKEIFLYKETKKTRIEKNDDKN